MTTASTKTTPNYLPATHEVPSEVDIPTDQDATGRSFGDEEMLLLEQVIDSGTLTSTQGSMVQNLEHKFAAALNLPYAHACCSGTAALHTAIAAIDPEPGDEIITSSITDMGAITPILYQGAIPVFADVDPLTFNLTAESIERVLSPRTKAIIVTHLFGNPCEMNDIMALANKQEVSVIEDCAQAYGTKHHGKPVGTFGALSCFSFQQGKHMSTGEGGMVTSANEDLARRAFLFINKAWGYGDSQPDHYFLALNYRMNELTGAVALAQMEKLPGMLQKRAEAADRLGAGLRHVTGIALPHVNSYNVHSYWKYPLRVNGPQLSGGLDALASGLRGQGVACAPRYVQKPAFECQVIREQRTFGNSRFPFTLARPEAVTYDRAQFGGTYEALSSILVLPINERYEAQHVDYVATTIASVVHQLAKEAA